MIHQKIDYFLAGTVGGILETIVGHPLETIKVLRQNGVNSRKISETRTIKKLYSGGSSRLLLSIISNSMLFGVNTNIKNNFEINGYNISVSSVAFYLSAIFTGVVEAIFFCPSDLIRIQKQVYSGNANTYPLIFKKIKENGGFYTGFGSTIARESLGNCVYLSTYQLFKGYLTLNTDLSDFWIYGISGGISGMMYWSFIFPIDQIKTIKQTKLNVSYKDIIIKSNFRSLYSGFSPAFIRAFPTNFATFVGFEYTLKYIQK